MSQPIMTCPKCQLESEDFDGLGVLHCKDCGHCTHASITGGVCTLCGRWPDGARTITIRSGAFSWCVDVPQCDGPNEYAMGDADTTIHRGLYRAHSASHAVQAKALIFVQNGRIVEAFLVPHDNADVHQECLEKRFGMTVSEPAAVLEGIDEAHKVAEHVIWGDKHAPLDVAAAVTGNWTNTPIPPRDPDSEAVVIAAAGGPTADEPEA